MEKSEFNLGQLRHTYHHRPEWRSIDTAPKENGFMCVGLDIKRMAVFIMFKNVTCSGYAINWADNANRLPVSPTHWMPLPEAPE